MTYSDFVQQLKKQVHAVSYEKGLAMAILISGKLLRDYQVFSEAHQWGNPAILQEAFHQCEKAKTGDFNKEEIDPLFQRLYHVTPDTEDFGDYDGSYALNAATTLLHALQYIYEKDPQHLFAIGTLYTDTIHANLQEMDIEVEEEIDGHKMMQESRQLVLQLLQ